MAKKRKKKKEVIITPAEAAKQATAKKKKPKPEPVKKEKKKLPPIVDLQDIGGPNLNLCPLLDTDCLEKAGLYPPDPRDIFEPEEMGEPVLMSDKVEVWDQIMSKIMQRFPLLRLRLGEGDTLQAKTLAFVDPEYGCNHWATNSPPTWMDPHIFAGMLLKDEEFTKLIREAVESNSRRTKVEINEVVSRVFRSVYLPYLQSRFNECNDLLVNWFLARQTLVQKDDYKRGPAKRLPKKNAGATPKADTGVVTTKVVQSSEKLARVEKTTGSSLHGDKRGTGKRTRTVVIPRTVQI